LITSGSMQALNLISEALIDPGDAVVFEEPTFPGAILTFSNAGAKLIPIYIDDSGINPAEFADVLERDTHSAIKLLYLQPTLQNPTGVSTPLDRRELLSNLCRERDVIIVEDDAYGVLDPDPRSAAFFGLEPRSHMIHVGTFSKLVAPGLRVGFIIAEEGVIRQLALFKQLADLHSSGISQLLVEGWLSTGNVDSYVQMCRRTYAGRLNAAVSHPLFQSEATVLFPPHGGFYTFGLFQGRGSARRIRDAAEAAGVSFAVGEHFAIRMRFQECFRLSISTIPEKSIHVGLLRLQHALKSLN
jgi:2-aminoadipate transaminase